MEVINKGNVWGPKPSRTENKSLGKWFLLYAGIFGGAERRWVDKRRQGIWCAEAQKKGCALDEERETPSVIWSQILCESIANYETGRSLGRSSPWPSWTVSSWYAKQLEAITIWPARVACLWEYAVGAWAAEIVNVWTKLFETQLAALSMHFIPGDLLMRRSWPNIQSCEDERYGLN